MADPCVCYKSAVRLYYLILKANTIYYSEIIYIEDDIAIMPFVQAYTVYGHIYISA